MTFPNIEHLKKSVIYVSRLSGLNKNGTVDLNKIALELNLSSSQVKGPIDGMLPYTPDFEEKLNSYLAKKEAEKAEQDKCG